MATVKLLLLPFFTLNLFLKNAWSWTKIGFEAFAFQIAFILLVVLNGFLGYTLYKTVKLQRSTDDKLSMAETHLDHQRQFWQKLAKEIPSHRQVQQAQKTLAE